MQTNQSEEKAEGRFEFAKSDEFLSAVYFTCFASSLVAAATGIFTEHWFSIAVSVLLFVPGVAAAMAYDHFHGIRGDAIDR